MPDQAPDRDAIRVHWYTTTPDNTLSLSHTAASIISAHSCKLNIAPSGIVMNIMIVSPYSSIAYGGAQLSLITLIEHLSHVHEVSVICNELDGHTLRSLSISVYSITWYKRNPISVYGLRAAGRLLLKIMYIRRLHRFARRVESRLQPDVIISQKPTFPYDSSKTRTICFVRDLFFISYFDRERGRNPIYSIVSNLFHRSLISALHRIDAVVANSIYTQARLRDLRIDSEVIYPFITTRFGLADSGGYILPACPYVLFLAATLSREKGVEVLRAIIRAMPDQHFVVIGAEGGLEPLAFSPNLTRINWVEDPTKALGMATALIVPSVWPETFGRVVIEAQRLGTPVVGSDVGGLADVIGDGGVLIDSSAPVFTWVEAITSICGSPTERKRLSKLARENAKKFQLEEALSRFDKLLTKVVARVPC